MPASTSPGFVTLGGGLAEPGLWAEPRFSFGTGPAPRPWAGLAMLMVLVSGVALLTAGASCALVEALPSRGARP